MPSFCTKKLIEIILNDKKAEEISEQELDVFFKEVPELNDTSSPEELMLVGQKLFEFFRMWKKDKK